MLRQRNLGLNALLNAFRNCLSIIFPLITYPYAFRILHAEGIGSVNYAASIVTYFTLIAGLGVSNYAIREGAKKRGDPDALNKFVNQVFTINVKSTIISYAILAVCLLYVKALYPYRWLILLSSASVGFTTLGVEWINSIFEDYLYITIRSIAVNLIFLLFLFVFVKDAQDYYIYAALTVLSNAVVCVLNWIYCRRYVKIRLTKNVDLKKHLPPILTLFVNSVAINIYVNIGVTMIGWMSGTYFVGIYEVASKMYTVIKRILAAVYTVAVPRASFYLGQGNKEKVKDMYSAVFASLTLLMLPVSVGLFCVAKEVVLLMGGSEYVSAVPTLRILSVALIGAIYGGMVTYCINIPLGREKINIKATTLSVVINVILNVLLIPTMQQNGVAVAVLISEFVVFFYTVINTKDIKEYVDIKTIATAAGHALVGCVSIALISMLIHKFNISNIVSLALITLLSVAVYAVELIVLKDENIKRILKR